MHRGQTRLQDERYLLLQLLGRGGMGQVVRAYDRLEQRLVALKFSLDDRQASPAHPLCREFARGIGLQHPNLVRTLELGHARTGPHDDGRPYLVLEHVHGMRVDRAFRPGHLSPVVLERLATSLLKALDHLHATGLIHRDVCPGNVLSGVTRRGGFSTHLADFGLAAPAGIRGSASSFSGSPTFAAPESFRDVALDGRIDLFGLGLMLILLGTGRHPLGGRSATETMSRLMAGGEIRLKQGSLPDHLRRFCLALTRRDRGQRPSSAAAAYRLLTSRELNSCRPPISQPLPAGRDELRLALDRARLGSHECMRVASTHAGALLDELKLWCREREIGHIEWNGDPARLMLELEGVHESPQTAHRTALRRHFPLELVGDQLLPDPAHRPPRPELTRVAAELVRRLMKRAASETIVLCVRPRADGRARALAREVVAQLEHGSSEAHRGWLIVVQSSLLRADSVGMSVTA